MLVKGEECDDCLQNLNHAHVRFQLDNLRINLSFNCAQLRYNLFPLPMSATTQHFDV